MEKDLPPSKVKACVETCMKAKLVPFIQSSPGVGKSSIIKEIANEYGLKLIDCRLSSMEPSDLQGLPWFNQGKAEFQPFDFFPLESTPIPKGYSGFLLFLDEFNSASRATQAAAYQLVLDREVGMHKLHDRCLVVAAGNKMTDNAIVNQLSTAMLSRVIHLNMGANFEDWRDNFALKNNIDERIIAYLSMYPQRLMEFNPDIEDKIFACPRTWHFVDKLIKASNGVVNSNSISLLSGAITYGQASAFIQFCKVYKNLIRIEDIEKNPDIEPPKDTASIWAIVIHLIFNTTEQNYKSVFKFIDKVPATFKVVFFKSLVKQNKKLLLNADFATEVQKCTKHFLGDD